MIAHMVGEDHWGRETEYQERNGKGQGAQEGIKRAVNCAVGLSRQVVGRNLRVRFISPR